MGGPCIGGNYWSNYETSIYHVEDVDEDGFGDVSYTARPSGSQLVTDALPLTDRLLYFVSPTPESWVNSREYLEQDFINVNISSYYNEDFTNVTLNLYKEDVLIDTIQTDNLSHYHEFTSLETGNYKITLTGTYNGEVVDGEERIIILGDCYYPINNSYVTLAPGENFNMCPGDYSYVRLYTNSENVNIDCNGAKVIGTGSSGQGIQLGSSASNVNISNCHFEAYSRGFYAYGSSNSDKIENVRIENSTFQNNWNNNLFLYYVKDSSFNNISAKGIAHSGTSDSYSSMYSYHCDTLNITNSEFTSSRGSGLYIYGLELIIA